MVIKRPHFNSIIEFLVVIATLAAQIIDFVAIFVEVIEEANHFCHVIAINSFHIF